MSIYKSCDIRGIFDKELFPNDASAIGHAIGRILKGRRGKEIIVAGDLRESTCILKAAFIKAVREEGLTVIDIGIVPTPLAYFARDFLKVDPLCIVTASHNPAEYNGFKLVLGKLPITPQEIFRVKELAEKYKKQGMPVRAGRGLPPVKKRCLTREYVKFIIKKHICLEEASFVRAGMVSAAGGRASAKTECSLTRRGKQATDERQICSSSPPGRLKVIIDASNGCYSEIAPLVFRRLGYKVVKLFCKPDGRFPNHPPNPADSANLKALGQLTVKEKADLGVCFDGDGDRVAFVDEHGNPIPIDKIIVLLIRKFLKGNHGAKVVYDLKASDIVPEEIKKCGGIPLPEKSGHTFIKTRMLKEKAVLGGEISGHYFYKRLNGGDDGLYSALLVSRIVEESGRQFSEIISTISTYRTTPDIRIHYEGDDKLDLLKRVKGYFPKERVQTIDGVKVRFPEGWGMVRVSVTEPVLTFRFESKTKPGLQKIARDFLKPFPQSMRGKVYEHLTHYIASRPVRVHSAKAASD